MKIQDVDCFNLEKNLKNTLRSHFLPAKSINDLNSNLVISIESMKEYKGTKPNYSLTFLAKQFFVTIVMSLTNYFVTIFSFQKSLGMRVLGRLRPFCRDLP